MPNVMSEKLRKQLDEDGYRETLPLDALPLVKHLMDDLSERTQSYKKAESSLRECKEKCESLRLSLVPYQEENGRLHTQVNTLQMEKLRLRESLEKLQKERENALHKLESEKQDLLFLVDELKRNSSALEQESKRKSERILQLQEKNLKAFVSTPGGTSKAIATHKQRMDISSLLERKMAQTHVSCSQCGCRNDEAKTSRNLYLADLLRMADAKIHELQQEAQRQTKLAQQEQQHCADLKAQISSREAEIARLQGLLEGGRAVEAILEDNKLLAAHSKLHQLQLQIELLNKTNKQLEAKLKATVGESHEAMNRAMELADENKDLTNELENAESTNRLLEQDCSNTAETLTMKLDRYKLKLENAEGRLSEQHRLYHLLRDERDHLQEELHRVKMEHSHLQEERGPLLIDKKKMEDVLKKTQEQRKHMADRLNHLTVDLQETDMEKHRLQSEIATLRSTIRQMEERQKEIEEARDFFKKEAERLCNEKNELELQETFLKSEVAKLQGIRDQLDKDLQYQKAQANELQEQKLSMEQEKDYYCQDVKKLQNQVEKMHREKAEFEDLASKAIVDKSKVEKEKDHYSGQVKQLLDILKTRPSQMVASISKEKLRPEEELAKVLYEKEILKQEKIFYKTQWQSLKDQVEGLRKTGEGRGPSFARSQEESLEDEVPGRMPPPVRTRADEKDVDMEALKSERDFFRNQMEHFQKLFNEAKMKALRQPSSPPLRGSVSPSPTEDVNGGKEAAELRALRHEVRVQQQEREFFQEQYERLKKSLSKTSEEEGGEVADPDVLMRERDLLRSERDFYMNQYKAFTNQVAQAGIDSATTRPPSMKQECDILLGEKRRAVLAKAELEAQVHALKDELGDLKDDLREKDSRAKELNKSIESMQAAAIQSFPSSMQGFVAEIRKSRDLALADLAKIKEERDSIKNKLRVVTSQGMKDRTTAQEDILALQHQKDECDTVVSDQQKRLQSQASLISSLQNQIDVLQGALQKSQAELGVSSKQSEQFRKILQQKTGEMDSQEHQLGKRASQLEGAQKRIKDLEAQLDDVSVKLAKSEAEMSILKGNIGKLDHDKDILNTDLDSKTETIAALREELRAKCIQIVEFETIIARLKGQIESCEAAIEVEKRHVTEENERCQRYQQDLAVTTEQKDSANREIRRLLKEVGVLNEDKKELLAELEKTRASRETFKLKAQEYCRTLEELTIAMSTKDKEQDSLVQQYLSLNETLNSLKSLNASLEESASNRQQEITVMEQMISTFKEEREQLLIQLKEASSKNEALETRSRQLEEEKFKTENDLLVTRELLQKTEAKKDEFQAEAARLEVQLGTVLDQKRKLEAQMESLSEQLKSDRSALRSLEELVGEKRKGEFTLQSSLKQLQVEKTQLQRRVSELQSQLEDELGETKRLRSRVAQTELDLERLRRELTEEQYERERTTQELRKARTRIYNY